MLAISVTIPKTDTLTLDHCNTIHQLLVGIENIDVASVEVTCHLLSGSYKISILILLNSETNLTDLMMYLGLDICHSQYYSINYIVNVDGYMLNLYPTDDPPNIKQLIF